MERPILFSGEMVRAILEGRKTQTRRVIKNHPLIDGGFSDNFIKLPENYVADDCPYGKPGDLLWVRESLRRGREIHLDRGHVFTTQYIATDTGVPYALGAKEGWVGRALWQWKKNVLPSIFMPRWASRLTLKIVEVRVERLQEISEDDACSEGVIPPEPGGPIRQFAELWDSINAKRGYPWDSNCWVWVIEFERC